VRVGGRNRQAYPTREHALFDMIHNPEELHKLTISQLRTIFKEEGLSGYSKLKKSQLVQKLCDTRPQLNAPPSACTLADTESTGNEISISPHSYNTALGDSSALVPVNATVASPVRELPVSNSAPSIARSAQSPSNNLGHESNGSLSSLSDPMPEATSPHSESVGSSSRIHPAHIIKKLIGIPSIMPHITVDPVTRAVVADEEKRLEKKQRFGVSLDASVLPKAQPFRPLTMTSANAKSHTLSRQFSRELVKDCLHDFAPTPAGVQYAYQCSFLPFIFGNEVPISRQIITHEKSRDVIRIAFRYIPDQDYLKV
jgi:hypothetical protein